MTCCFGGFPLLGLDPGGDDVHGFSRVRRCGDHSSADLDRGPLQLGYTLTCGPGIVTDMTKPVGPYTPIVKAGPWLVSSGQIGIADGALVGEDLESQLRQAIANLAGLLESEGASLSDVTKTTVFMVNMDDYAEMNGIYVELFGDHRPARSAVAVAALPLGARVEIEASAYMGE